MKFLVVFLAQILLISRGYSHQIQVTNQCQQTIWVGTYGDNDIPAGGSFRLDAGQDFTFPVIDGWTSGRVWGKTGCDDSGQNCVTGDSPPGGRTTLQPVTLAEFGLDKYMGLDFYDISCVDGFNLPLTIQPFGVDLNDKCRSVNCNFDFNVCPESFKQYGDNGVVACNSACSATHEDQYCCPAPPYDQNSCHPSDYSRIFKNQCPDAFSYAFDEDSSTWACQGQGQSSSGYQVVFCP